MVASDHLQLQHVSVSDQSCPCHSIHRHRRTGSSPQSRRASQEKRQAILKMDPLVDDPHQSIPFLDGTLAFAGSGKNSRREEVFLSLGHQR